MPKTITVISNSKRNYRPLARAVHTAVVNIEQGKLPCHNVRLFIHELDKHPSCVVAVIAPGISRLRLSWAKTADPSIHDFIYIDDSDTIITLWSMIQP